jgi:hypothetical protein
MLAKKGIALFALFLVAFLCCQKEPSSYKDTPDQEILTLSFPKGLLEKGERVLELEITVLYGSVLAINNIPEDWSIDLTVDPQWRATVSGRTNHGVGALDDVSTLQSFLVIRPWRDVEKENKVKFNVEAKLCTTFDFEHIKTRPLQMADIILREKGVESKY